MNKNLIAALLVAASAALAAPHSRAAATARHRRITRASAHRHRSAAKAYKPLQRNARKPMQTQRPTVACKTRNRNRAAALA